MAKGAISQSVDSDNRFVARDEKEPLHLTLFIGASVLNFIGRFVRLDKINVFQVGIRTAISSFRVLTRGRQGAHGLPPYGARWSRLDGSIPVRQALTTFGPAR